MRTVRPGPGSKRRPLHWPIITWPIITAPTTNTAFFAGFIETPDNLAGRKYLVHPTGHWRTRQRLRPSGIVILSCVVGKTRFQWAVTSAASTLVRRECVDASFGKCNYYYNLRDAPNQSSRIAC